MLKVTFAVLILSVGLVLASCGRAGSASASLDSKSNAAASLPKTPGKAEGPASPPSSPESDASAIQRAVAEANRIRREQGFPEFTLDSTLSAVAQAHAEDMLKRNYFEHDTPEGLTPFQRMDKAGLRFHAAAENIAMGVKDPMAVFQLWLDSPGHKRNLLNSNYGRQGVGYAGGYWVHDFAN